MTPRSRNLPSPQLVKSGFTHFCVSWCHFGPPYCCGPFDPNTCTPHLGTYKTSPGSLYLLLSCSSSTCQVMGC